MLARAMRLASLALLTRRGALRTTSWHMMPGCHGHLSPCGPCSKAHTRRHSTSKLWDSAFSTRTRQVTALTMVLRLSRQRPTIQSMAKHACGHPRLNQPGSARGRRRPCSSLLTRRQPPRRARLRAPPRCAGRRSSVWRLTPRMRPARLLPTSPLPNISPPPPRRRGGATASRKLTLRWRALRCPLGRRAKPRSSAWPPTTVVAPGPRLICRHLPVPLPPHRPSPPPLAGVLRLRRPPAIWRANASPTRCGKQRASWCAMAVPARARARARRHQLGGG